MIDFSIGLKTIANIRKYMVPLDNAKLVLKPFFLEPSKPKYIRQIANECELSYERVQHYLRELEEIKAVKSKTKGKIKEYSINRRHELVLKIFSLLEMERRQKFYSECPRTYVALYKMLDEISKLKATKSKTDIKFVVLFGSAARKESRAESDIDILVAVTNKDSAFEKYMFEVTKKLYALTGNKFSIHSVDIDEIRTRWKKEPFYSTFWPDHIVLYGDEYFWKEVLELGEPI